MINLIRNALSWHVLLVLALGSSIHAVSFWVGFVLLDIEASSSLMRTWIPLLMTAEYFSLPNWWLLRLLLLLILSYSIAILFTSTSSGDATISELVDFIQEKYEIDIMILSAGNACLYNAFLAGHKSRKNQKVTEVYTQITKNKPSSPNYMVLEINASDEDDVDVQIPTVKFIYNK